MSKEGKKMFRVIDSKTYETLFVGFTVAECQQFIDKHNLDNVFIEKVVRI